jgi:erythromycin esterase
VSLRLDRRDATIAGHVAGAPLPDDARVVVTCRMDDEWAIFLVDVDRSGRDGRFEVALPDTFCVARVAAAALSSDQPILRKGASAPSTIHVARYAAPPDDTVAWVKAHAVAVSTDRDEPADDLRPLAPLFAGARVWGLGQSALGAHELVDLKDRVIRSLVSERRCAAVVLDVGWGDALGIDEFVHTGRFEAMAGLVGDRLWNWRTYEGQQLIAWLRRWNLDPRHHKVHVYGVGEGGAARAVAPLRAFLDKMDPAAAAAIAPTLAFLVSPRTGADLDRARAAIGGLVADFDRNRARWTARAGAGAWRLARQHARFFEMRANLAADRRTWEQELYEMMRGIVELAPGPIAVWDDEVDVAFGDASTWGGMLRRSLGDRYRAIGFLFHRGNVLASDPRAYGPAPVGDVGEALARAGIPAFGLSLRGHGGAGAWLDDVRPYRHVQRGRADADFAMSIGLSFDGVFFVDEVSPVERVTVEKP